MLPLIRSQLVINLDTRLIDELLNSYEESKRAFYLGGLRLGEVEGGRFSEAVFRLLQQITTGSFTPLGTQINTDQTIAQLASIPSGLFSDSIRLHIPRCLRIIYDIRNNRDAAHLADGIDPNIQDASIVIGVMDWILAELIRLYHHVPPNEAREIVYNIVIRKAPIIQDFNGFLKVLNPNLSVSEHCLVLLYHRGANGAVYKEIEEWVRPSMKSNLRRTLTRMCQEKDYLHFNGSRYYITRLGQQQVESLGLLSH